MIGILNYKSGNIQAIVNIYDRLNVETKIITTPDELNQVDKIILPGVGAFDSTISQLQNAGFKEQLDHCVLSLKMPILGICVGMQIMGESSEEGVLNGLGWIKGRVKKFDTSLFTEKPYLPHMGWNTVIPNYKSIIFEDMEYDLGFYFVHSYYFECLNQSNSLCVTDYGLKFSSGIQNGNIYGVQFHPEKSHTNGIRLLHNFSKI